MTPGTECPKTSYDYGYDAGYSAALADAAEVARNWQPEGWLRDTYPDSEAIAAAIEALGGEHGKS